MADPTIGIVTPTIGNVELLQCLRSVYSQTIPVKHYLVIDGYQYVDRVFQQLSQLTFEERDQIKLITLEENVGKEYYSHRAYASVPILMNCDYVMYLDADNWLNPNHAKSCLQAIQEFQVPWAFSYRNIHRKDGSFVCQDQCESVGVAPCWNGGYYHIDSSCFCVDINLTRTLGMAWYGKWGQDRVFCNALRQYSKMFAGTGQFTVNYRLGGNEGSVQEQFFTQGNIAAQGKLIRETAFRHQWSM